MTLSNAQSLSQPFKCHHHKCRRPQWAEPGVTSTHSRLHAQEMQMTSVAQAESNVHLIGVEGSSDDLDRPMEVCPYPISPAADDDVHQRPMTRFSSR